MLASTTGAAIEMFTVAMFDRQHTIDQSGLSSSGIYVAGVAGTALMGLFGSRLLRNLRSKSIGFMSPAVCGGCVVAALAVGPSVLDFWLVALAYFAAALDFPNVIGTLNRSVDATSRSASSSAIQSAATLAAVCAPILSAGIISFAGDDAALLTIGLVLLLGALPWFWIPESDRLARTSQHEPSAYRLVMTEPGLRGLLSCRVLSNLVYVGVPAALPFLVAQSGSSGSYVWATAVAFSSLKLGLLAASVAGAMLLATRPMTIVPISKFTPVFAGAATIWLATASVPAEMIVACFVIGVCQLGARLTGMVLGPSLTTVDRLPEVILASDTVVRLFGAAYGIGVLAALSALPSPPTFLAFAAACSLPAPLLLKHAFPAYLRQLSERRHVS